MTIEELLAIEEIKRLRLGYAAHFDAHELDRLMALFADDAVCEFGPEFGGNWVGAADIRERYAAVMRLVGEPFDAIHIVTNPWITLTGPDTAHGRWYLQDFLTRQKVGADLVTHGGHANPLFWLGVYEDDYRRIDGVWKIARVRLHFVWPTRTYTGLAYP